MTTETLMTDGAQATDPAAASSTATTGDATQQAAAAGAGADAQTQQTSDTQAAGDKPAAEAKPADQQSAKPDEQANPAGAPEKYEAFKLADGALTADEVAAVEKLARDLNLPQDAAQKLAETRAADKAAFNQQMQQTLSDKRAEWVDAVKADKDIGGDKLPESLAVAKKGLQFADPQGTVAKLLESTGFGDHPDVIRLFHRIGTQISEDRFVPAQGSRGPARTDDAVSVLYPNQQ
jgi:hypothetical protein